jgi:predicted ATPase
MQREMLCTCREDLFDAGLLARVEAGFAGWCAPEVLRANGEKLLRQDPAATGEAEALFVRALALGRQQGALFWELRTGTSLARLWRNQGEGGKARRLLEPLLPRFGNDISSLDLETSRALLVELS